MPLCAWCLLLLLLLLCCRELAEIHIPAGLLSQGDGEALKELLRKGPVSVALNWTDLMPKASKVSPARRHCSFQGRNTGLWQQLQAQTVWDVTASTSLHGPGCATVLTLPCCAADRLSGSSGPTAMMSVVCCVTSSAGSSRCVLQQVGRLCQHSQQQSRHVLFNNTNHCGQQLRTLNAPIRPSAVTQCQAMLVCNVWRICSAMSRHPADAPFLPTCIAVALPQDFKPVAKQLESAGLVSFQPHYLIWVCQYGAESEECKTQCIRNGAYCCPDPDDNIVEGYSGADVLMVSSCWGARRDSRLPAKTHCCDQGSAQAAQADHMLIDCSCWLVFQLSLCPTLRVQSRAS
jgi:hypothetical protein